MIRRLAGPRRKLGEARPSVVWVAHSFAAFRRIVQKAVMESERHGSALDIQRTESGEAFTLNLLFFWREFMDIFFDGTGTKIHRCVVEVPVIDGDVKVSADQ